MRGFGGSLSQELTARELQALQRLIGREKLSVAGNFVLAQYHGLSSTSYVRRNELLRQLDSYDVWGEA